ncbi:MAG TPA: ATP synthase F0 subunit B [Dehalococcoidia bacterium]|nr:ATP synthase F0 subunit B [Dehalococcoidia bacterium]
MRRKHIEMLGREFSIVKDGLDPKEVVEFLEASTGSSEAAFKHLEQFSAFQSVARAMEKSIEEAKQMAEQAKAKAKLEADRVRAEATAEVQQQSSAILDQTMRSCITSVEGVHSVILEAVASTEKTLQTAFMKTREMVATSMAEIQQNIQTIMDGQYPRMEPETEVTEVTEVIEDVPELSVESTDVITFDDVEEEEADKEPVFDLANLQESLMSLEMSLSNLHESKSVLKPTLETQVNVLEREEEEETEEVEEEEEEDEAEEVEGEVEEEEQSAVMESHDEGSPDTVREYSGNVTVQIVGGAEESWMQELRKRMLNLPGARIRAESGVDEKTTMVSLTLGEPVRLFPILLSLPKVSRVVPGRLNGGKDGKLRLWPKSHKNSAKNTITVELHTNGRTQSALTEAEDDPMAAS